MDISQKQIRKEQILSAALKVIVQKGYEKSRMDDIVQVSKLSKGAIYWYYKSKKDVYLSLVNLWVIRYSAVLNHMNEDGKPASQQLQDLFQYFINQYEKAPDVFKALLEFWSLAGRDADFKQKVNRVYKEFLDLIKNILIWTIAIVLALILWPLVLGLILFCIDAVIIVLITLIIVSLLKHNK